MNPERSREDHRWSMVARLRDGVDIGVAQARMDQLALRMGEQNGTVDEDMAFVVDPSQTWAAGDDLRRTLWIFMGSAGLLIPTVAVVLSAAPARPTHLMRGRTR